MIRNALLSTVIGSTLLFGCALTPEKPKEIRDGMAKTGDIFVSTWYDQKEVTFEEYDKFCEETKRPKPKDNGQGRGKLPVVNVTWDDADAYCRWCKKRLPGSGEWRKALGQFQMQGVSKRLPSPKPVEDYAWFAGNSGGKAHPGGEKNIYQLGLYDILGNVREWTGTNSNADPAHVFGFNRDSETGCPAKLCFYVLGASYKTPFVLDPALSNWRAGNEFYKVFGHEKLYPGDYKADDLGFRCVR